MKNTKTIIFVSAALILGIVIGATYKNWFSKSNESAENPVELNALALSAEYGTHRGFNIMDILNPVVYAVDYNPKDRCRAEYQVWGEVQLSHPQEIHTTVEQQSGTPGGVSVKAESVDRDPEKPLYRVKSNYPMTEEQLLLLYEAPDGWLVGKWISYGIHTVRETCLPTQPQSPATPKR